MRKTIYSDNQPTNGETAFCLCFIRSHKHCRQNAFKQQNMAKCVQKLTNENSAAFNDQRPIVEDICERKFFDLCLKTNHRVHGDAQTLHKQNNF